jgi:hypothetical protein
MSVIDILHRSTGGRPFVLMVMPYKDARTGADLRPWVFDLVKEVAEREFNVACVRADQLLGSGGDLREKIHDLIDLASLVIVEMSEDRPNVFYEFGYAAGRKKTPVLLLEEGLRAPYNAQGLEVLEYQNTISGAKVLREKLAGHLRGRLSPELPLLREMLAPSTPHPSYIVASPKYPGKNSRIHGSVFDRRTFGDHLGMLGVISAFGLFYGNVKGVELISAQHSHPDLLDEDFNLYLLGSEKVNPRSGELLAMVCKGRGIGWEFAPWPDPTAEKLGDWPVGLYRIQDGVPHDLRGTLTRIGPEEKDQIWTSDYGLIVRTPHPKHPNRLAMIMAGPHSLGTAAACLAATRVSLIQKIKDALPSAMEDRSKALWVLVKGTSNTKDFHLDEDGVTIEDVGVYE